MITISEKDGATIIVIENPSGSEQRIIEQAKNVKKFLYGSSWGTKAVPKKEETEEKDWDKSNWLSMDGEGIDWNF